MFLRLWIEVFSDEPNASRHFSAKPMSGSTFPSVAPKKSRTVFSLQG
jgi:hypothetical protein